MLKLIHFSITIFSLQIPNSEYKMTTEGMHLHPHEHEHFKEFRVPKNCKEFPFGRKTPEKVKLKIDIEIALND